MHSRACFILVCIEVCEKVHKITARKSEGKKPLATPRHMWKGNSKMEFKRMKWEMFNILIWFTTGSSGRLLYKAPGIILSCNLSCYFMHDWVKMSVHILALIDCNFNTSISCVPPLAEIRSMFTSHIKNE
jgi:hypothetical protein